MKVDYVCCSTADQSVVRQLKIMVEQKVENIFIDKVNGKNVNRKDFKVMIAFVYASDAVIEENISRIARNLLTIITV